MASCAFAAATIKEMNEKIEYINVILFLNHLHTGFATQSGFNIYSDYYTDHIMNAR